MGTHGNHIMYSPIKFGGTQIPFRPISGGRNFGLPQFRCGSGHHTAFRHFLGGGGWWLQSFLGGTIETPEKIGYVQQPTFLMEIYLPFLDRSPFVDWWRLWSEESGKNGETPCTARTEYIIFLDLWVSAFSRNFDCATWHSWVWINKDFVQKNREKHNGESMRKDRHFVEQQKHNNWFIKLP
jgi:hypothetical protein